MRPFIMMRFVGSRLALGAPRPPLPFATVGVAAHPTIKKRAPNFTQRKLSKEMSPPREMRSAGCAGLVVAKMLAPRLVEAPH